MPDLAKKIVYLSQQQYNQLITNETLTVNGTTITYSDNDLYVTPQEEPMYMSNQNLYVKKTDTATTSANGAIKLATTALVKAGTDSTSAIIPSIEHEAVFYGLAKAAGDSTQASSNNAVGTYTSNAKAAIQSMLGITEGPSYVITITDTAPVISGQPNARYVCGEVTSISIAPPSAGTIDVRFISGATPATLVLSSAVKMPTGFNSSSLAANTIYEILISDGVYGGVMTWPV